MFYIIYNKNDKVVLFTKNDLSTGWHNTSEQILNQICEDRQVDVKDYVIEETVELKDIRTDGSQIYNPSTKTLSNNPAYVPPPAIETSQIPVSDPTQGV